MKKILDSLFKAVEILIAFFLAAMIILVFTNVVLRYVFNKGFGWSEEIARLCFIYLVYLGSIGAARDNRHLLIDSLLLKLPAAAQKIVYTLVQVCVILLMCVLTAGSWGLILQNLDDNWVATKFPTYLVYAAGFLTGTVIIIISTVNIFRLIVYKIPVEELVKVHDDAENGELSRVD